MSAIDPLAAVLGALDRPVQPRPEFAQTLLSRLVEELGDGAQTPTRKPRRARLRLPQRRSAEHATRSPRRVLVLVALVVLAFVLMAAVAYALGYPLINFSSAPRAAQPVVREFSSLSLGAPPGMDPRVNSGETPLVGKIEGQTLWVAPTKAGGLCYEWSRAGGGCDALGTVPLSVSWLGSGVGSPLSESFDLSFQAVDGFARARWVDAVEIRLDDGSSIDPQLIWISSPIAAGFYYYRAPEGRTVKAVLGLKDGEVVDGERAQRRGAPTPPHPYAELSKRQRLAATDTREGVASLWSAPTKAGLRCTWLEFRGEEVEGLSSSCIPQGYEHLYGLSSYAVYALGGDLILAGKCGHGAVELIHRDGSVRTVRCVNGIVLAKLAPTDAAGELAAIDEDGHLVGGTRNSVPPPTLQR